MDVQVKFGEITGGRLVEGYGLTEAAPVTHCNPIYGQRKTGSIGLPFPDVEAKIVDYEKLTEKPVGEDGELWLRAPQVMKGYWNKPEETAKHHAEDGWLRTGDIARMDDDGYFYIVDRLKDIIIASGFNIVPREVEEVLFQHPKVQEAVVAGVPDPYRGETVKAYIVLKPGETATPERSSSSARRTWRRTRCPSRSSSAPSCRRPWSARCSAGCWWRKKRRSSAKRSRLHCVMRSVLVRRQDAS